jgi:methylated-DNA-[protein]-cysteine S-methyltransferase
MDTYTRHAVVDTPLGVVTLVASGDALVGVSFSKARSECNEASFGDAVSLDSDDVLLAAEQQLAEFLSGDRTAFELQTDTRGDAFQKRIWSLIDEIPFGQTTTLGELTKKYAARYLARDIGQAINCNPLAVIVPSHRVVGPRGNIGGYAGGLERKRVLLEIEGHSWIPRGRGTDLRYYTLQEVPDAVSAE